MDERSFSEKHSKENDNNPGNILTRNQRQKQALGKLNNTREKDKQDNDGSSIDQENSQEKSQISDQMSSESDIIPMSRTIQFRNRRGQKIQQLLNQTQLAEDDFWNNNKYFGNADNDQEDQEEDLEYQTESQSGDVFDEDFDNDEESEEENESEFQSRQKTSKSSKISKGTSIKKKIKKMKSQINGFQPESVFLLNQRKQMNQKLMKEQLKKTEKFEQKGGGPSSLKNQDNQQQQKRGRYIHDFFTQEQLLKEAVVTEYLNQKSLEQLMQLEEEKKLTRIRKKTRILSPKITYRDSKDEQILIFSNKEAFDQNFEQFRQKKQAEQIRRYYKYRDPLTKQGYNSIEEYQQIRKMYQKQSTKLLGMEIKVYKDILERKKLLLEQFPLNQI